MTKTELATLFKGMAPAIREYVQIEIGKLEKRLANSKDSGGADAEGTIKNLLHRIQFLEAKPSLEYHGVYRADTSYKAGAAVTLGGSVWVANQSTSARPGEGETAWRLAVKCGRDGRDGKDLR